jgi:hypothetical protein
MHRFQQAPPPDGFDAAVGQAVADVASAIKAKRAPKFAEGVWKKFAGALSGAQHGKCGFCESKVPNVTDPDVEHYHPKNQVAFLSDDEKDWGEEVPNLARLRGRKKQILSRRGYWWLAYKWNNYLLACGVCNRKFKVTIFPVRAPKRLLPPREDVAEEPLLLNPYFGPDPAEHLSFDRLGAVAAHAASAYGRETIKTCGLYRQQLIESRIEKASEAHELVDELLAQPAPPDTRQREILRRLLRMGDERFIHCGMVRSIFRQRSGMSWSELEERLAARRSDP